MLPQVEEGFTAGMLIVIVPYRVALGALSKISIRIRNGFFSFHNLAQNDDRSIHQMR